MIQVDYQSDNMFHVTLEDRDYVLFYMLCGRHDLTHGEMLEHIIRRGLIELENEPLDER